MYFWTNLQLYTKNQINWRSLVHGKFMLWIQLIGWNIERFEYKQFDN